MDEGYFFPLFLVDFGEVDWKTFEADIKFSMYWPKTWFSDLSFKFSSFTLSTRRLKSTKKEAMDCKFFPRSILTVKSILQFQNLLNQALFFLDLVKTKIWILRKDNEIFEIPWMVPT